MDESILEWLLSDDTPEVRLRTLKEYQKLSDDNPKVIECKSKLLQSKIYERGLKKLKKLKKDKPWEKFDEIMAFAELGYYQVDTVKEEISCMLGKIKEDGGFGCISSNKKINDPKKPHKSCARLTVEYLLLVAELHLLGIECECEGALVHYFTKRNIFYRRDNRQTPMVDVMLETFYPSDPIKVGVQNIVYALRVLGCPMESEAMQAGYKVLNRHRLDNGRYILTASKSVPAFKAGKIGEKNKWITLYAYMAQ